MLKAASLPNASHCADTVASSLTYREEEEEEEEEDDDDDDDEDEVEEEEGHPRSGFIA